MAKLRADLRLAVVADLPHNAELELAVREASIRHLSERIAAYERAYGLHNGEPTTRWNVLSAADLEASEGRLNARLRSMLVSLAGVPDGSISLATRGQVHELRSELEAIRIERTRRVGAEPPRLLGISRTVTAADRPKALAAIEAFAGRGADRQAERALLIEIEKRLSWSNSDASLKLVRDRIHMGPFGKDLIVRVKNAVWDVGWPPGRGPPGSIATSPPPPPKDGPGGPGVAIDDVRHGVRKEIEAIISRNPLQQAEAAAGREVGSRWLSRIVGHHTRGFGAALAVLSAAELEAHAKTLTEWKAQLIRQQALSQTNWRVAAELLDVDTRLLQLQTEIMIRGPPPAVASGPRGPEALLRAANIGADAPATQSYSSYTELAIEQRRLVELEARLATANEATLPTIKDALAKQLERRVEVERKIINEAHGRSIAAERQAYVNGRGIAGAQAAQLAHDAQISMRQQADGMRARADRYVYTDLVSADRIPALRVDLPRLPDTRYSPLPELLDVHARIAAAAGERPGLLPQVSLSAGRAVVTEAPTPLRFDSRFPRDGLNSAAAFRSNPIRAPGGVIVDVRLPEELTSRLAGIRYDAGKGAFEVQVGKEWRFVSPSIPPQTARAALGFLLDERVAAVDIGEFDEAVLSWLIDVELLQSSELKTMSERGSLLKARDVLRIVRINPALADTLQGHELIAADELIFKALSLDPILPAARTVFNGVETIDLHTQLRQDLQSLQGPPQGYKSVLTVDRLNTSAATEHQISLRAEFDYAVYAPPYRLDRVSAWFKENDAKLRAASRELVSLEEFAVAVALVKWARESGRSDELAGLRFVVETASPTPSLMCRSKVRAECEEGLLKKLISTDNDDGR